MKLPYNRTQIILEAIGALMIISISIAFILSWSMLPAKIPTHFNFMGEIDSWGNKNSALFLLFINIATYILLTVLTFFPKIWNTPQKVKPENMIEIYNYTKTMLILTKVEVAAIFSILIGYTIKLQPVPIWFLSVFLILINGTIILYIFKFYKINKK